MPLINDLLIRSEIKGDIKLTRDFKTKTGIVLISHFLFFNERIQHFISSGVTGFKKKDLTNDPLKYC